MGAFDDRVRAEATRRAALVEAAAVALRPVVEFLAECKEAGVEARLRLVASPEVGIDLVEGTMACPAFHPGAVDGGTALRHLGPAWRQRSARLGQHPRPLSRICTN